MMVVANPGDCYREGKKGFCILFISNHCLQILFMKTNGDMKPDSLLKAPFFPQISPLEHVFFFSLSRVYLNICAWEVFLLKITTVTENDNLFVKNKE